MKKTILVKTIGESEHIVYLMNEDGVKIKAFVEFSLEDAQLRVNELASTEDMSSIDYKLTKWNKNNTL